MKKLNSSQRYHNIQMHHGKQTWCSKPGSSSRIYARSITQLLTGTNFIKIVALYLMIFISGGCGYRLGSIMHPGINSIAIAPIKNETKTPFAATWMRQSLSEQFQFDGSLKLKSLETADCILYGRILKIVTTATSEDTRDNERTYRAAEWSVAIEFEFTVIIPGKLKPLINKRKIKEQASYQVMTDYAVTRRRGIQQACRQAAIKVVQYTVEAW